MCIEWGPRGSQETIVTENERDFRRPGCKVFLQRAAEISGNRNYIRSMIAFRAALGRMAAKHFASSGK